MYSFFLKKIVSLFKSEHNTVLRKDRKDTVPEDRNRSFKSRQWIFSSTAKKYAQQIAKGRYDHTLLEIYCDVIAEYLPAGSAILDAGAGTGALSLKLSARGFAVTALDISDEMLSHIGDSDARIRLKTGDLFELSQTQDTFEAIVSRWVVPHFSEWQSLVRGWAQIVKPGGYIMFDMPNREHIERFSDALKFDLSRFIGYDHTIAPTEAGFYACASAEDLQELADSIDCDLVARRPHGLWKSNLDLANLLGGEAFQDFMGRLNTSPVDEEQYAWIKLVETSAAIHLQADAVHGSLVVLRKRRAVNR